MKKPIFAWIFAGLVAAFLVSALAFLVTLFLTPAQAPCGAHIDTMKKIEAEYAKGPTNLVSYTGAMIDLTLPGARNWTRLIVYPNGRVCLISANKNGGPR